MKKQLTVLGISIILLTGASFTTSAQKKEGKNNKKEQGHNGGKSNDKPAKANNKNEARNENNSQNSNSAKQGKNDNNFAKARNGNTVKNDNSGINTAKKFKENNGKSYLNIDRITTNGKGNNGKNNNIRLVNINNNIVDGYNWNSETFKNRNKIKDQKKVAVCHKLNGKNEPGVAISVSSNALKAHMNHGDVMGGCPEVKSNIYSSTYLQKRANYYNVIENNNEQVSYSKSIYDYAVARLTKSRLQLVTLQNNNTPVAEIEQKQAVVVELEQNVSLLETLIGVATTLIVNKLQ